MRLDALRSVGVSESTDDQRNDLDSVQSAYLKVSSSVRSQWSPTTGYETHNQQD
jgi:hypothetical protein